MGTELKSDQAIQVGVGAVTDVQVVSEEDATYAMVAFAEPPGDDEPKEAEFVVTAHVPEKAVT